MVAIRVIDGMPGVGKTALAVHAAHLLAGEFPDRQLFADLHGHTSGREPVTPLEALAGLLAATGADPRFVPADVDGRVAMWRDRMAGQRAVAGAGQRGQQRTGDAAAAGSGGLPGAGDQPPASGRPARRGRPGPGRGLAGRRGGADVHPPGAQGRGRRPGGGGGPDPAGRDRCRWR